MTRDVLLMVLVVVVLGGELLARCFKTVVAAVPAPQSSQLRQGQVRCARRDEG